MADATKGDPSSTCPVDHKTRAAWLSKHATSPSSLPTNPHAQPSSPLASKACASSSIAQSPSPISGQSSPSIPLPKNHRPLSQDREISSIPRAFSSSSSATSTASAHSNPTPANAESSTSHDNRTGNWIYPSERQFFDAMRRKNYSPSATDMPTIIPIHNAVNERAWSQILDWERRSGVDSKPCGGPKLYSFKGLGGGDTAEWWAVTPKARFNGLLGYQMPFDRHDWVVERCGGETVEYVIDFYEGKGDAAAQGMGKMSFYIDARPKLNSWEGWRMRMWSMVGL